MSHFLELSTPKRAGFTMTELMVAVAIMGMVATAAAVEVVKRRPHIDLNRASWEMTAQLRRARLQAVSRNAPCTIEFDAAAMTCTSWTDVNGDGVADPGEQTTADLSDIAGLNMKIWPRTTCTFDARGTFTTDSREHNYQYIQLKLYPAGSRRIHIYPSGQVDLQEQSARGDRR